VRIVLDSGLARVARADPRRGINTLLIEKISRASADQRAGRAGRTAPGVCMRLWTAREHALLPAFETPELHRVDLSETVLTLKAGGVEDLESFPWFEPPDARALAHALTLLRDLGALDSGDALTEVGRRMAAFPAHPRYSRMLLEADRRGCVRAAALMAALVGGRDLFVRNAGKAVETEREEVLGGGAISDFQVLMRAWRFADRNQYDPRRCARLGVHAGAAREVGRLHERFLSLAEREGLVLEDAAADDEALACTVLAGFADQVARRADTGSLRCRVAHGRTGTLARSSVARDSALMVVSEIREIGRGEGDVDTVLSLATTVREEWLEAMFPDAMRTVERVHYDALQKRVVCERARMFRDLVLESGAAGPPPAEEAARLLAAEVEAGRVVIKAWDDAVDQWITRVNRVSAWFPEMKLPRIEGPDRRALLEHVCHGALSVKDVKDREVWPVLRQWLSAEQAAWVEAQAPERFKLPGGRAAKVRYAAEGEPVLAARIQDLYGVTGALSVASGRAPLVIEVLAPNFRPVQVTRSLETFWAESYPRLKQELQRKYPKHEWR
jgi:ATP-dependent helicase HrpB